MKIAVLSSHTYSLFWYRMDMMKDFIANGHSVVAFGPDSEDEWAPEFRRHNIEYKQFLVKKNGINPLDDLKTYKQLIKLLKDINPDKVFTYQAKTVVYGSLAAKRAGIKEIYILIAGLGSIFRGTAFKTRLIKPIMRVLYKSAFNICKKAFFHNDDDKDTFVKMKMIPDDKTVVLNGTGINLEKFNPTPLPEKAAFLLIGRLIKDKGIIEYLEACKIVKRKYPHVRCMLVGPYDTNPSAIHPDELKPYIVRGDIEYFGIQKDVRNYISQCSTYVLPSYHEGRPKTVLEAMAMGRAIITTDAPGCRHTVIDGKNGYLVPVRNVEKLVEKMEYLINNMDINSKMGEESLKIAKVKYDVHLINNIIMNTMDLD